MQQRPLCGDHRPSATAVVVALLGVTALGVMTAYAYTRSDRSWFAVAVYAVFFISGVVAPPVCAFGAARELRWMVNDAVHDAIKAILGTFVLVTWVAAMAALALLTR